MSHGASQSAIELDRNSLFEDTTPGAIAPIGKVSLLEPADAFETIDAIQAPVQCMILDPWYNKGFGGVDPNYFDWLKILIQKSCEKSEHVFLWGFPEIVAKAIDLIPESHYLVTWITWYYKNCPSVIRGWRPSQNACLHIAKKGAHVYLENFLNEEQAQKFREGKLRYIPGPSNVIEESLLVGFVGQKVRTGHPSQKPYKVIERLIKISTKEGDLVLDPMCGSGTTGEVCQVLNRRGVLADISPEYLEMAAKRLNIQITKRSALSEFS